MKACLEHLIKKRIINFQALMLAYFRALELTPDEALAAIELQRLLEAKVHLIKPRLLSKALNKSVKETEHLLNRLMDLGYLNVTLKANAQDKEEEIFDLDFLLIKLSRLIETEIEDKDTAFPEDLLSFMETTLQRTLMPKDYDYIKLWLNDHRISHTMIRKATLDVVKLKHPSMKHIDQALQTQLKPAPVKAPEPREDILKDIRKLWEK